MPNAMHVGWCLAMLAVFSPRARADNLADVQAADRAAVAARAAEVQAAPEQAKADDEQADREWKAHRQLEEEQARRQDWIREHGNAKPQRAVARAPGFNAQQKVAIRNLQRQPRGQAQNARAPRQQVVDPSYDVEAARRRWIAAKSVAARRGNLARGNAIAAANAQSMNAQLVASARRAGW